MKSISLFTLAASVASISTSVSAHSPHSNSDSSIHRRFHHKQLAAVSQQQAAETTALAVRESDEKHQLIKRGNFNGRATFFDPGLGACGTYSGANDYVRP